MAVPHWASDALDLSAYLARIGVDGPLGPDAATLERLHRAHAAAIPFENIDPALGRDVPLGVEQLQEKLVAADRGGYCYEQNLLFAAVLERAGFAPVGHAARIRVGGTGRPATHMVLTVATPEGRYLADVGFGGGGLLAPLELDAAEPAEQDGWGFRLAREEGGVRVLRSRSGGEWSDLYGFTEDPRIPADFAILSYYCATHPRSPFTGRLMIQAPSATADGAAVRFRLMDTVLTTEHPDGREDRRDLAPAEIPEVLSGVFGIRPGTADTAALTAAVAGFAAEP